MVRVIAFIIGLGFAGVLLISLIAGVSETIASPAEATASPARSASGSEGLCELAPATVKFA